MGRSHVGPAPRCWTISRSVFDFESLPLAQIHPRNVVAFAQIRKSLLGRPACLSPSNSIPGSDNIRLVIYEAVRL
jgi:hypothetical protein